MQTPRDATTPDLIELLQAARSGDPRWYEQFGGALEVARVAPQLQSEAVGEIAQIRAEAIRILRQDSTTGQVAAQLGITRQMVSRLAQVTKPEPDVD